MKGVKFDTNDFVPIQAENTEGSFVDLCNDAIFIKSEEPFILSLPERSR